MRADERVPATAVHKLNPGHIHLHQRAAAPLACLEHDEAQGTPRQAVLLKQGGDTPLGTVEHEGHVAAAHLVLDDDAASAPEFKVVAHAQPLPRLDGGRSGAEFIGAGHGFGNKTLAAVGSRNGHTTAGSTLSGKRIVHFADTVAKGTVGIFFEKFSISHDG